MVNLCQYVGTWNCNGTVNDSLQMFMMNLVLVSNWTSVEISECNTGLQLQLQKLLLNYQVCPTAKYRIL